MNFVTAYFWQPKTDNACALLLQKARHKQGYDAVLACVCENDSAGAYLTGQLRDFFRKRVLSGHGRMSEKRLRILGRKIEQMIDRAEREAGGGQRQFSGVLCIDRQFVMFGKESDILMQNTRFGRAHVKKALEGDSLLGLQYGVLQEGVGLLLGSRSLLQGVDMQHIRECLMVEEIAGKKQADRHLSELCGEAVRNGAKAPAAILLVSGRDET